MLHLEKENSQIALFLDLLRLIESFRLDRENVQNLNVTRSWENGNLTFFRNRYSEQTARLRNFFFVPTERRNN